MPQNYSLGHGVAEDMRMSAGIAMHFKSIYKRVGNLMDQKQKVDSVTYLQENNQFIYYLLTKELSKHKPTYNSITAAITKLSDLIVEHGVKKLAIHRIGCGLDKLGWSRVKCIIENLFQNTECTIKVCHFTHNMLKESELLRVEHPGTIKIHKNINDIQKREFHKLNIILYSQITN
ncbi:Macro domain-containing protein, partial [Aphis craccivora]